MRPSTKSYNYDHLDFKVVTEDQFAGHQGPDLFDTEKTKPKLVFELCCTVCLITKRFFLISMFDLHSHDCYVAVTFAF